MKYLALLAFFFCLIPSQANALGNPVNYVVSTTAEASHVLKAKPGSLFGFSATTGASAGYVMLFDATAAPSNGTVTPVACYYIPSTSSFNTSWSQFPLAFNTGIVIEFSTTGCFAATSSSTAFFSAQIQ